MGRMSELRVLAISGSLRRGSYNTALVGALPELAPPDMTFDVFRGLGDLPLYNEDLEGPAGPGTPPAVLRWRQALDEYDGIVLCTPEYSRSLPGVVKNAFDWASRPPHRPSLSGKVVLVLVATPGRALGYRGLSEARTVLTGMRNLVVPAPEVVINSAAAVLEQGDGTVPVLTDPIARGLIGVQLTILGDLVRAGAGRLLEESFRRHIAGLAAAFAPPAKTG
jgi:chromate reductase